MSRSSDLRYIRAVRKTGVPVDEDVVRRAMALLGAAAVKDVLDAALREVLAAEARRRFSDRRRDMHGSEIDRPEVMAGAWR
jgi:Arc/MetJ family transcription regulator